MILDQKKIKNKVSILVPVYNAKLYIEECLDSIRGQTFRDFEVIVIDDGSMDGSGEICDQYARMDTRFHVFHQKNKGITRTREIALEKAQGKYIFWCDSDDYVSPQWLQMVLAEFNQSGADIVCFGAQNFSKEGVQQEELYPHVDASHLRENAFTGRNDTGSLWKFSANKKLWNCETFADGIAEDGYMTARLFLKANSFSVIQKVLYFRRIDNNNSLSHGISGQSRFYSFSLWKYRRSLCQKYYSDDITYCEGRMLSDGVKSFCLSIIYKDLREGQKKGYL